MFQKDLVASFVDPPSKELRLECPICFHILREPKQATCCGTRFCQSCIQDIKDFCPNCRAKKVKFFFDRAHKQHLYGLKVYCDYRKDGCEWIGELGQLDKHHNKDSKPEKGVQFCQFIQITCCHQNCKERIQRRCIQNHQLEHCPHRPFSCEHCDDFDSTFDDVTKNHLPVCGSVTISCPNSCGSKPQRQNIEYHLASECPLEVIICQFHHVGCSTKFIRKNLSQHLQEYCMAHTSFLATSHLKQLAQIENLVVENDELKSKNSNLEQNLLIHEANFKHFQNEFTEFKESVSEHITSLQTQISKLDSHCTQLVAENLCLRSELKPLQLAMQAAPVTVCTKPLELGLPVLEMIEFEIHRREDTDWHSPPVYTHSRGYNICIRVDANGEGSGAGTHVSVFINFVKGDFDHCLKWPFRGAISVRVLDQCEYKNHKTESIIYDDTVDDKDCRVAEGDTESWGWGNARFIAHSQLNPKYLKNDSLLFQIVKVELQ